MSIPDNLKVSIVGNIYWIESEIGMIFYDSLQRTLTFPSVVNIAFEDLELVISELNKVKYLIEKIIK